MKTHVKSITEVVNRYAKHLIITQRLEVEMLVSENRIRYEVAILQSLTSLNICVSALPCPVAENHSCHGRNRSESETCEEKYLQSCF